MMRTPALILMFIFSFLISAQSQSTAKAVEKILKDVRMGMPLSDFKKLRPNAKGGDGSDFRVVMDEIIEANGIKDLTFYFDAEGKQPFYEVIIEFKTAVIRDEIAAKFFGKLNHPLKNDHWVVYNGDKGYRTVGWTYESRLIYCGQVPNSEWEADEMFEIGEKMKLCDFRFNKNDDFSTVDSDEIGKNPDEIGKGGEEVVKKEEEKKDEVKTGDYTCEDYARSITELFESGMKLSMPSDSLAIVFSSIKKMPTSLDFRDEFVLKSNKNGLKDITFLTSKKTGKALYEVMLAFENADSTMRLAEMMFGKANHPTLENHWVIGLGAFENEHRMVSLAWVYENKFMFATNLLNTELTDDESFKLPDDFIEKWNNDGMKPVNNDVNNAPTDEATTTLQMNNFIAAAVVDFEDFKGEPLADKTEEFLAKELFSGAEQTIIRKNAAGKWRLEARFTTQSTMDDAALVYDNQVKIFQNLEGLEYRIVKKSDFSSATSKTFIWDVQTLDDASTGVIMKLQLYKTSKGEFGIKLEIGK
jgi:hypothetical protein